MEAHLPPAIRINGNKIPNETIIYAVMNVFIMTSMHLLEENITVIVSQCMAYVIALIYSKNIKI